MLEAAYKDTLFVISDEMKVTLNDIRSALELAIETKDSKHLSMVRELMYIAKGALVVIDFKATALLAMEMIKLINLLLEQKIDNRDAALDALSSGVLMLPAFFTKTVESEGLEQSIALLPVLQELRAARQAKPLSEQTLTLLNIKGTALADKPLKVPPSKAKKDLPLQIGKYRPAFQSALLGWIKGEQPSKHLTRLSVVSEKFAHAATHERVYKVWWLTAGVIEALLEKGLQASHELRQLLGQVDRLGKSILDKGEDFFQESTDSSLINQLLYFISRSTSSGKRVTELRKTFSMQDSVSLGEKFDEAKTAMAAPDTEIMHSLTLAIREDLDKVKDALDIFNRTGSKENIDIEKRFESLKKIADTLQMLGLVELEQRVLTQQKEITGMLSRNEALTDDHLISVAASLLQVETKLEAELDKLGGKKDKEKPKYLLQALEVSFLESKVNLARVKEVISQFMRDPTDVEPISRAPLLLNEARAASIMAEKNRLAAILGKLQDYISQQLIGSGRLPFAEHLDLLAGAIESVDFYLETLNKGRRDPWYMLDNAESCLEQLLREAPAPLVRPEDDLKGQTQDSTIALQSPGKKSSGTVAMPALSADAMKRMQKQNAGIVNTHPDAYPIMDQSMQSDPEVIEIFIEEANEVQADIEREFQVWRTDNSQREAMVAVRRGFHTLKGSGRMVGAKRLSELAWQAEHLINRSLEGIIQLDDDGLHLVERAVAVVPILIEQLEIGTETQEDAHQLMMSMESFVEQKIQEHSERNEVTHLPGHLDPGVSIADTHISDVFTDSQTLSDTSVSNKANAQIPPTKVIDMRSLLSTEAEQVPEQDPEGLPTKIVDMREIIKKDNSAVIDELVALDRAVSTDSDSALGSQMYRLESPLYEIYTDESARHIQTIREFCSASPDEPVNEQMYRAVHTLHGTANMAGLTAIMDLAAEFEHYVKRLYDEGLALTPEANGVVSEVVNTLESMVATVNQAQAMPFAPPELIRTLHDLRTGVDHLVLDRVDASNIDDESKLDFSVTDHGLEESSTQASIDGTGIFSQTLANMNAGQFVDQDAAQPDSSVVATSLTEGSEQVFEATETNLNELDVELDDILMFDDSDDPVLEAPLPESELSLEETDPDVAALNDIHTFDDSDELVLETESAELGDIFMLADANTMVSSEPVLENVPTLGAVDSEITAIFLEEAEEIIVDTDAAVATWEDAGLPDEANTRLQRHLHTLKGGARMAGLLSIGDFTHETESFVIALRDGSVAHNDDSKRTLQSALDHMHKMLADVENSVPPSDATEVIHAMHGLQNMTHTVQHSDVPVVDLTLLDEDPGQQDKAIFSETYAEEISLQTEPEVTGSPESVHVPPALDDSVYKSVSKAEPVAEKSSVNERIEQVSDAADSQSLFEYTAQAAPEQQRQQDAARISTNNLETLLNQAGEVSIFRSRIEQELSNSNLNLVELARTVQRVKEQLRKMEIETEATILYQHRDETDREGFDPLEMDRYSNVQQVSRALAESVNDLSSLESLLENQFRDTESLLLQQSRVMTDLQDNLMRVRMVPFARYAPRYARIVRQIASETGKEVELNVVGADSEIDRQVIERMQAPLEHMIRNAVIHGIESPAERRTAGKDPEGSIDLHLSREGAQLLLELKDDGAGLNLERIREKALSSGLLTPDQAATDADIAQLILNSGLSTAESVTQSAGRGVGMDVVASEIKQLGGSLQISTEGGIGTRFLMRLPFTRAINQALMVRVGEENYAIPIHKIDGVAKMTVAEMQELIASENPVFAYANLDYEVKNLSQLVGLQNLVFDSDDEELSLIMVTGGDHRAALVVSELFGSREMVIKPVGPQVAAIRGISGATILGDGRIVVILDMDALLGVKLHEINVAEIPVPQSVSQPLILVVDDSITVRRVTERLLERNKIQVLTARDGLDALNVLQEHLPDLILLDIEMPRMDGYEFAEHVRKDERTLDIPIIMITSRTGDKHRRRAMEIGVDDYLGKPYREDQLLEAIKPHLAAQNVA